MGEGKDASRGSLGSDVAGIRRSSGKLEVMSELRGSRFASSSLASANEDPDSTLVFGPLTPGC